MLLHGSCPGDARADPYRHAGRRFGRFAALRALQRCNRRCGYRAPAANPMCRALAPRNASAARSGPRMGRARNDRRGRKRFPTTRPARGSVPRSAASRSWISNHRSRPGNARVIGRRDPARAGEASRVARAARRSGRADPPITRAITGLCDDDVRGAAGWKDVSRRLAAFVRSADRRAQRGLRGRSSRALRARALPRHSGAGVRAAAGDVRAQPQALARVMLSRTERHHAARRRARHARRPRPALARHGAGTNRGSRRSRRTADWA